MIKTLFKSFLLLTFLGIALLASIFLIDKYVTYKNNDRLYSKAEKIPSQTKVGLLLGTNKTLASGRVNLYYQYRVEAAAKLYKAGKIQYIIASGDNSRVGYDEPTQMKESLVALGVPANKVYLDYAGFRTLDSVVRAKEIFGQTELVIISQKWHNERALFIANNKDISAIAFNAKDISKKYGKKVLLREKLARVKMMLDLLIGKQPHFLGDPIKIG